MIFRCCEDAVGDTSDAQKTWGSKGWKSMLKGAMDCWRKNPQEPQVLTKSRVFLQILLQFSLKRNSFQLWPWAPHIDTAKWMVQSLRATIDVSIHSLQSLSSVRAPSDFAGHQKIIPYWSCWVIHKKQNNAYIMLHRPGFNLKPGLAQQCTAGTPEKKFTPASETMCSTTKKRTRCFGNPQP